MSRGPSRYELSDGTDISRMTVDQIKAHQARIEADEFLEEWERRQRHREVLAARFMLAMTIGGLGYSVWDSFGWVIAGFNFVGFVATFLIIADNKRQKR